MAGDDLTERLAQLSVEKRALFERWLMERRAENNDDSTIPRAVRGDPVQLSFAQQRLWFLNQLEPLSCAYNEPQAVRLRGCLDVGALQKSLDQLVARHEVLRTTFVLVDGCPVQMIAEARPIKLRLINLQDRADAARQAESERIIKEAVQQPFDLSRDLMLRALLLRLEEQEHILLFNTHHIASDGWSAGILWQEVVELYRAFVKEEPNPLNELPIQYRDFALWQRQWLQGEVLEKQLSYWTNQLAGLVTVKLPTDGVRPPVQTGNGAKQHFTLSAALSRGLQSLSRQHGATLFMTLLAAFQTLLHRYSGQNDIVVGSPIAGRTRPEIEKLIGFFTNSLALRTNLAGSPTFADLLVRVREVALSAYAHQDLPFEKLVEELRPARHLNNSPLFQVMFALQNLPSQTAELPGIAVHPIDLHSGAAKFDLTLSMREDGEGLKGALEYDTDLFRDATITRLLGHWQILLESVVANPNRSIADLPILTKAEKNQLLLQWNDTKRAYPKDECVHQLFEEQVLKTPDAVAVVFEDRQVTYGELNRRANQLARYLGTLGVAQTTRVGICLDRSIEMVVAALAILKTGSAYVPLDPGYPKKRLAFMVEDTAMAVLLTEQALITRLPATNLQVVCLDQNRERIALESWENPDGRGNAEDLAYVVYTSGSTGEPKGVAVPHRAVNRLVLNTDYVQPTPQDVIGQASSFSFDASTFEIWGALMNGARLVMIAKETILSPPALSVEIKKRGITVLFLTTALFNRIIDRLPTAFENLDYLLFGGEAVDARRVGALLKRNRPKHLIHVYGPTESTTFATWYAVEEVAEEAKTVPIGRPIANTQIYLLDKSLQTVPIGVTGEIHIGGDGLGRGYLNRPDLTAENFIPNPFTIEPGGRLYKTGDLARYLPGGNIEFAGRVDDQVKIRGFRIEPAEIEAVVSLIPGVQQAAVLAREDVAGEKCLTAYVVPDQENILSISELRSLLKDKLPEFMVPSAFVLVDHLPLTPQGKLDRSALPDPEPSNDAAVTNFLAPRTLIEDKIAAIWGELLGHEQVGINDNFFDLGGHSLLALQLFARLRERFAIDLPVRALFESPTVAGFAIRIEAEQDGEKSSRQQDPWSFLVELQPGKDKRPVFIVPGGWGGEQELIALARLARHVGSEFPFYGLRARSGEGIAPAHRDVREMARNYLTEIRSVQTEGPYFLIGECIAGAVAYELAQQLRAEGQKVGLLALLDAQRPTRSRYLRYRMGLYLTEYYGPERMREYGKRIAADLIKFRRLPWRKRMSILITEPAKLVGDIARIRPRKRVRDAKAEAEHERREVKRGYVLALRRYLPQAYLGRMTLLSSAESSPYEPTLGWRQLVSEGVEVIETKGDHHAYIRNHVQILAKQLRECLERAEKELP